MKISNYKTVSEWYKAMKSDGYEVPLALYHTLSKMINEQGIFFSQAYQTLLDQGKIEIVGNKIKFYLNEKEKTKED